MENLGFDFAIYKTLIEMWPNMPIEFKKKYASYRSKHFKGSGLGDKKKREILIDAGFTETWTLNE